MVGLSYRQTPLEVREKFSFSKQQIAQLIERARKIGINSIFPISTCNRTEIYAQVENPQMLLNLFDNSSELKPYAFTKNSNEAVAHLFNVTAGLDSQILGDAQITGQVREFLQIALQHQAVDAVLNRLVEDAIGVGKKIKTRTRFNSGTSSLAHAAVKHVMKQIHSGALNEIRALIIGAGKMGRLTAESLLRFLNVENITIINRTDEKAIKLASRFGVNNADFSSLKGEIRKANLIFAATSSGQHIITRELLRGENLSDKIFIDLSLPRNVESSLPATVIAIDRLMDDDKTKKENYIRIAGRIIGESISNFYEWLHRYELAQDVKRTIHDTIFDNSLDEPALNPASKFVDGITGKYLRHFQKEKQSRNLAA